MYNVVEPADTGIGVPYPVPERGMPEVGPDCRRASEVCPDPEWGTMSAAAIVPVALEEHIPSYYWSASVAVAVVALVMQQDNPPPTECLRLLRISTTITTHRRRMLL